MERTLIVGDPHGKISRKEDFSKFLTLLLIDIVTNGYPKVIILGDLFDTFAVVRVEILALWTNFLLEAAKHTKIVLLTGNHDLAGEQGGDSALQPFKSIPNVHVVTSIDLIDGIWFIPFMRDNAAFETLARELPRGSMLFCHQSFNGAQFESGTYDPHGADPKCVSHLAGVISGHIHLAQKFGNIWYPGTPYQMSFKDANSVKGSWVIDLSPAAYNVVAHHPFDLPTFHTVETATIDQLHNEVTKILAVQDDLSKKQYQLVSKGTPHEIDQFNKSDSVKALRRLAMRVVDALDSIKAEQVLPGTQGLSRREKLHEFIKSRNWRSSPDRVLEFAVKYLPA